jgi:catechol 2,3-dioxygenase-like lactoylglutathione lyase family enzyme
MQELVNGSTAIFVNDIEVSKNFYCNILGLKIHLDFGKNVIFEGFALWEIGTGHIIPRKLGIENITGTSNRFELYFETEDIEGVYNKLVSKNVSFLHGIHEEPWGQHTIRFFDPDSHLIETGESMKKFVRRFHDRGMTISEISQKTSVPVEEVKRLLSI